MIRETRNKESIIYQSRNTIASSLLNETSARRNNTYCPMLWDSAFVNEFGDVFFCCEWLPGAIGNINEHSLNHIWKKSREAKVFRWMSLNGFLSCFSSCTFLSNKEKAGFVRRRDSLEYPSILQIQFGTFCTVNCIMCPQDHRSRVMLDNKKLKANIDWEKIDVIILQGGEILAMEDAKKLYLWLTERMHKKVNVFTNGLLINQRWAESLIRNSNWLEISINAATKKTHESVNKISDFDRVMDNVRRLIQLKLRYKKGAEIRYHFTIVPENIHEIADAIKVADDLGCDLITYSYEHVRRSVINFLIKNKKLKERIKSQILKITKNDTLKIKIQYIHLEQLGLVENIHSDTLVDTTFYPVDYMRSDTTKTDTCNRCYSRYPSLKPGNNYAN